MNKCPICNEPIKPCPFCGQVGKIYGPNLVGCTDNLECGGEVDGGAPWGGPESKAKNMVCWTIKRWNRRPGR